MAPENPPNRRKQQLTHSQWHVFVYREYVWPWTLNQSTPVLCDYVQITNALCLLQYVNRFTFQCTHIIQVFCYQLRLVTVIGNICYCV